MTISEALGWRKTLIARYTELVGLRNDNSNSKTRFYGDTKEVTTNPTYDVKSLDRKVSVIAKDIRKLDDAIKATNSVIQLSGYEKDDNILDWTE